MADITGPTGIEEGEIFDGTNRHRRKYLDSLERLGDFISYAEEGMIIIDGQIYPVELEFRENGVEAWMENIAYHYHKQ